VTVGSWIYEPKWDGFRCLIFRDGDNVFLQSKPGKSLTAAFPEIVAAVLDLNANHFVLDGEVAIRSHTGFSYRPGDDHSTVKIKNYRSADCVIGGFRDHSIGSARNELLLGLYDQKERLQYVGSVGIDTKQKQQVGLLRPKKTTTFYDRQPGKKSHWSGEAAGPWKPVAPTKVVEVRYDHFSDQRFRHGCTFLRVRPDKLAKDCLLEQVFQQTVIHDISAFIDAGLATAGTNRKIKPYLDRLYANL
jgi:ATP-dependent DNA ligase